MKHRLAIGWVAAALAFVGALGFPAPVSGQTRANPRYLGLGGPGASVVLTWTGGDIAQWAALATGSGTVNSGGLGQIAYYAGAGTAVSGESYAAAGQGGTGASNTGASADILIGQGSSFAEKAVSGDAAITSAGVVSLKSVGAAGTYGDATHVAQVTTDAQGRVSGASSLAITFPAPVLPSDYISGLPLAYSGSGTYGTVTVGTGTAMVPGTPNSIVVSGAGTSSVNGTYTWNGTYNAWFFGGASGKMITNSGSYWYVSSATSGSPGTALYESATGSANQFVSGATWTVTTGSSPAPTAAGGTSYGSATAVTVTTALTWTPAVSLPVSAFSYIYLTIAGALVESVNAPVLYQGTARQDLAGDRYLGGVS